MDLTHLLFVAALFALLLVCGVFWGLYFALSRSYQVFSAGELAKIARTIVANLEVPMRNISLLCLALLGLSPFVNKGFYQGQQWADLAGKRGRQRHNILCSHAGGEACLPVMNNKLVARM